MVPRIVVLPQRRVQQLPHLRQHGKQDEHEDLGHEEARPGRETRRS